MINLAAILSPAPYRINERLKLYQPVIKDIISMTEEKYWMFVKIWVIRRDEIVQQENSNSILYKDYEIWKMYILSSPELRKALEKSILIFFRKKMEFLPMNSTIYIGDIAEGNIIDEKLYLILREVFSHLLDVNTGVDDEPEQYKKDIKMDARTKALVAKMEAGQKKVQEIKNGDQKPEEVFGKQIVALVAIGHYTFEQVYNMTMLQFIYLLKKYVDIENFELYTLISPYISSDKGQENTHWLNT